MDYNTLVAAKGTPGSLADYVNDSRIQSSVTYIIEEAQSWIYRRLRHWRMFSAPLTGVMTVGNDFIATPTDFLEPHLLWITGTYFFFLDQKTSEDVYRQWSYDQNGNRVQQQPMVFSFNDTNIFFDSQADQAYPYALVYYQQPALLSVGNPTNWLTTYYARLLRVTIMAGACEWLKEAGQGQFDRMYWEQLAQDELAKAQAESDRARRGVVDHGMGIGGGIPGLLPLYGA